MKRLEKLDEALAPDGSLLTLYRRDGAYSIRVGSIELMSTRRFHSEEQLAELVCSSLCNRTGVRLLIGGLGMGFTLRAALRTLPADADVLVCEVVGKVIEWNQNLDYGLGAASLADPRVEVRHADVADVLRAGPAGFDAIMLDVDNGAEALTTGGNAALYRARGVAMAKRALRPGGRIGYWSAGEDAAFVKVMEGAGLGVETHRVRAHRTSGGRHVVMVGKE